MFRFLETLNTWGLSISPPESRGGVVLCGEVMVVNVRGSSCGERKVVYRFLFWQPHRNIMAISGLPVTF